MNENNTGLSWVGSALTTAISFIQVNQIAQYITFGLGVLTGLVTLAYTIYKWVKRAAADKKITEDELKELVDIVSSANKEIQSHAEVLQSGENPNE